MKRKKTKKVFKQKVEENFFTIIIFLVLFLTIVLIISLFTPIGTKELPETALELNQYVAGINRRTILVRSISYIISGVSVVIAFISLMQSKNSELKRERMQVMPYPAYAILLENNHYSNTTPSKLVIETDCPDADIVAQTNFDVTIKNIGLGSLVDYEIREAYFEDMNGDLQKLKTSFASHFVLGKGETVRIGVNIIIGFKSVEAVTKESLEAISIRCLFTDLLGHSYTQQFTIKSEVHCSEEEEGIIVDGLKKKRTVYSINPKQMIHTHPNEE